MAPTIPPYYEFTCSSITPLLWPPQGYFSVMRGNGNCPSVGLQYSGGESGNPVRGGFLSPCGIIDPIYPNEGIRNIFCELLKRVEGKQGPSLKPPPLGLLNQNLLNK